MEPTCPTFQADSLPAGFPNSSVSKESACNAGEPDLIPGSGRPPWRMDRLPTPVFWPGEFNGLYSPWGHKESDMTERLSPPLSLPTESPGKPKS